MNRINFQQQADEIGISVENLLSLYNLFVDQTEGDIIEMESLISKTDVKALKAISHHIKGASLNLEISTLVESAKSLEVYSEQEEWNQIASEFENFKKYFEALKSYIQKVENE